MTSICDWEYHRLPHIITVKDFKSGAFVDRHCYFNGGQEISDEELTLLPGVHPEEVHTSNYYIENDDNVKDILAKVAVLLSYKPQYLYCFAVDCEHDSMCTLGFEYLVRSGKPLITTQIPVLPPLEGDLSKLRNFVVNTDEPLKFTKKSVTLPTTLPEVNITDSNILGSYGLKQTVLASGLAVHQNIYIIPANALFLMLENKYKLGRDLLISAALEVYYPHLSSGKITELKSDPEKALLGADSKEYSDIDSQLLKNFYTTNVIVSDVGKEGDGDVDVDMKPCTISEIIIHVNYDQSHPEFVDQVKIFDMYRLNENIPFARFRGDNKKQPRYRLFKDITDPKSEIYISEKDLANSDWMTSIKRVKDTDAGPGEKNYTIAGKGLSYKVRLYKTVETDPVTGKEKVTFKYMTFNLYKDGKIEIKCSWDKSRPASMSDVIEAIKKVRKVIKDINKLQYHTTGTSRKLKIKEPDPDFLTNPRSNTKIAFFNILSGFTAPDLELDKLATFALGFGTYVAVIDRGATDLASLGNSIEMRYKRVSGYTKMSGVFKFISDFERNQGGHENRDLIKSVIADKFGITSNSAEEILKDYDAKFGIHTDVKGKKRTVKIADSVEDAIRASKNPGIDIKITKQKDSAGEFKISILGVTESQLKRIYFFLTRLIELYRYDSSKNLKKLVDFDYSKLISQFKIETVERDDQPIEIIEKEVAAPKQKKAMFEEDEDEFEWEEEQEEEPIGAEAAAAAPPPPPVARKKEVHVHTKAKSLLNRLVEIAPDIFQSNFPDGRGASRICQKEHQPVSLPGIDGEKRANELMDQLKEQISKLDGPENAARKTELSRNLQALQEGVMYKGNFYFCPFTWDFNNNNFTAENWDSLVTNKSISQKDYLEKKNIYFYNPSKLDKDLKKNTRIFAFKDYCIPCCARKGNNTIKARYKECLGLETKKGTKKQSEYQNYVLDSNKIKNGNNRLALLPEQLNNLFHDGEQCELAERKKIKEGTSCVLRKGTLDEGNYFLNCVAELLNQTGSTLLTEIIKKLEGPEGIAMIKTLKNGSINNIFSPLQFRDEAKEDDEPEVVTEQTINNFVYFMNHNKNTINENYLWDIVAMPGMVRATGINLFVIEGYYGNNNQVRQIVVKCPVGYDTKTLFSSSKPSLVLYKYGRYYEIICSVTGISASSVKYEKLFPPGDAVIKKLIGHIQTCHPVPDETARIEYQQFLDSISKHPEFDEVFNVTNHSLSASETAELITKMIDYFQVDEFSTDFTIVGQVLDTYNKVRYLVLDNGLMVPVQASGIYDQTLDIMESSSIGFEDTVRNLLILQHYGKIAGLEPHAFLIDPGADLDDPSDDRVIGLILKNGLSVPVSPHILVTDAEKTKVNVSVAGLEAMEPIRFDCSVLKFSPDAGYSYYDEESLDNALYNQTKIHDNRELYSVRANFEEESYERLRFELSKYLQTDSDADEIKHIIETIIAEDKSISDKRTELNDLLSEFLGEIVTQELDPEERKSLESQLGPLNVSYDEVMSQINSGKLDLSDYKLDYIKPLVRYECLNVSLDPERASLGGDPHCSNHKLYISKVNLVTGNSDNLDYYVQRVVEELIRNPFKRYEILQDQIENYVEEIPLIHSDEYYIDVNTGGQSLKNYLPLLNEKITSLYQKGVDYKELTNMHYDVANPSTYVETHYEDDTGVQLNFECRGTYHNLPIKCIKQIGTNKYQIYQIKDDPTCIFNEIAKAINTFSDHYVVDNIKQDIANKLLSSEVEDEVLPEDSAKVARYGWQLARDMYSSIDNGLFKRTMTQHEFREALLSEKHYLNFIDLSLISRIYDLRFIIFSQDSPKNPNSISCLKTTQSLSDRYILLYLAGYDTYQIVHDTSTSPAITAFTEDNLPDKLMRELWVPLCTDDHKDELDPINQLFKSPPEPRMLKLKVGTAAAPPPPPLGRKNIVMIKKPKPKAEPEPGAALELEPEPEPVVPEPEPEPEPEPAAAKPAARMIKLKKPPAAEAVPLGRKKIQIGLKKTPVETEDKVKVKVKVEPKVTGKGLGGIRISLKKKEEK